jgi:Tol biopolymer transport system component
LRIIGLEEAKPRILYSNKEVNFTHPYDWSPDGEQILAYFERKNRTGWITQIVLVSTADGSLRVLKTFDGGWPENMCFSPDGHFIVYDFPPKEDVPERDIFLLSADGSREIPLVEYPSHDELLGWMPDGENIIYSSDRNGTIGIWINQVVEGKSQGNPKLIKSGMEPIEPLGFTREGSFYYGISQKSNNIYTAELNPKTGKITAPRKKTITRFEGYNQTPDYSPDGKYLAYISRRFPLTVFPDYTIAKIGGNILCIKSLETGKEREIFTNRKVSHPRWSPEGHSVIVMDHDKGGYYRIDTQTGLVTPVLTTDDNISLYPHERSLDGKTIFYVRRDKKAEIYHILVRDIESGTEKEIYRSKDLLKISLSPDEQSLALLSHFFMSDKKPSLKVMPSAGGEPHELFRFDQGIDLSSAGSIVWTADGKYILFTKETANTDDPKRELFRIPAEGGEPEKLGLEVSGFLINLTVHPDGRQIAFSTSEQVDSEIWVIENLVQER